MSERSKLDPSHIAQLTYDEASEAVKVKIQDAEMSIELKHDQGDSVTSHPAKLVVSAMSCDASDNDKEIIPPMDCSSLSEVRVDVHGNGGLFVLASPTDTGDFFYHVGGAGVIHQICARRIKVLSVNVVGDVHLVGRA